MSESEKRISSIAPLAIKPGSILNFGESDNPTLFILIYVMEWLDKPLFEYYFVFYEDYLDRNFRSPDQLLGKNKEKYLMERKQFFRTLDADYNKHCQNEVCEQTRHNTPSP